MTLRSILVALALALLVPAASSSKDVRNSPSQCVYGQSCGSGGGMSSSSIYLPTGSPLNLANCSPAVVGNSAVGAALTVNLCPARAGMEVWVVWEDATKNIVIEPNGSDTISSPEVVGVGDGLTWTGPGTVGSIVHLISLKNGEWRVFDSKGATAVDNNSGP